MKRRIVILLIALFLVGVAVIPWTLAELPPARYVLRYGLSPRCEPTGVTLEVEGVTFVEIRPGIFRMGSTFNAEGGDWLGKICAPFGLPWGKRPKASDEMPVHWVEFRRGFWIATTEITNAQFERFRPNHERSAYSRCDDTPVVEVSGEDAKAYCSWLAEKSGRPTRLPSEAEWECACRAGSEDEFTFGGDEARLSEFAWFEQDVESGARAVATKLPNRWGLHDLHGNVWEWCEDTWHDSHDEAPCDGSPRVDDGAPDRVERGGGWFNMAEYCRSAVRYADLPSERLRGVGFRPAFVPSKN